MHILHIITPSDPSTSVTCIGLLRITTKQLGASHNVLVIGNEADATSLRDVGLPIVGFVDGILDHSRTLPSRIANVVSRITNNSQSTQIIIWGWHATIVASEIECAWNTIAVVDEIDRSTRINPKGITIIPTSWTGSHMLLTMGVPHDAVTEPLIGVEPVSVVVDRESVMEMFGLSQPTCVVALAGSLASWEHIIDMVVQLQFADLHVDCILPRTYRYRHQLMRAAHSHDVLHLLHETPDTLRFIDVMKSCHCVWAPPTSPYDESTGVLDVLAVAWEGVPLAVPSDHPSAGVPTVGHQIAWAKSDLDVCTWILDLEKNPNAATTYATDLSSSLKSIASPTRFVEGLQLRM